MGRETDKVTRRMKGEINKLCRRMTLDINRRLAENTPLRTGYARSNWLPSRDRPADGPVGSRESPDFTAASAGVAAIESWNLFRGPAFITNNVPYIIKLNAGSSPQAPPGFVQTSIEQGIAGSISTVLR